MILKHRRGTTQEWLDVDLIPEEGELVLEELSDGSWKCKIGNGSAKFSELPYLDDKTKKAVFTEIINVKTTLETELINLEAVISKNTVDTKQELTNNLNNKYTELLDNISAVSENHSLDIIEIKKDINTEADARSEADQAIINLIGEIAKGKTVADMLAGKVDNTTLDNYFTKAEVEGKENSYIKFNSTNNTLYIGNNDLSELIFNCGGAPSENNNGGN